MNAGRLGTVTLRADLVVCILFYNKIEQTLECIRSFLPSRVAVHVLDNGSDPAAASAMRDAIREHPQVRMLDAGGNRGVAAGRNLQIQDTNQRWLFFVDNDITVATHNWLERLTEHISACPQAEVHVPKLYNKHEGSWGHLADYLVSESGHCTFIHTRSEFSNSFPGGASVIDRKVFERVGRYDEDMFVGFEDFELAIRAWRQDKPVLVRRADDLVLIHDHRASGSAVDKESAKVRYDVDRITRSHGVIRDKHGVLLDPNFEEWLAEQVRQVTGEATDARKAEASVRTFAVQGRTITPIHCPDASVLVLVPLGEERPDVAWLRLRALAHARLRAQAAGLRCHVRALLDGRYRLAAPWLEAARQAGLLNEWIEARGTDGSFQIGDLEDIEYVGWAGPGWISGDWLTRSVQHLEFSPGGDLSIVHPGTLLVMGEQAARVEQVPEDLLTHPAGGAGRTAFVASAAQWRRFGSGSYARRANGLGEAVQGWLYEASRYGGCHYGVYGAALLIPDRTAGFRTEETLETILAEEPACPSSWEPWLWFEQSSLIGLTRHLPALPAWAGLPVAPLGRAAGSDRQAASALDELIDRHRPEGISHLLLLPWLRRGGADKAAICYLQALSQRHPGRVLALTTEPGHSPWERFLPPCSFLVNWAELVQWSDADAPLLGLLRLMRDTRVRTLHVMNSLTGWQLLVRYGVRVQSIARTFASLFWYGPSGPERLLGYAPEFLPRAAPYLDCIITDNRSFGGQLHRDYGYPPSLFQCVYHPVESIADDSAPTFDPYARRVLWASRFAPEKRLDLVLALAQAMPDTEFLVFGEAAPADDPLVAIVAALAELPNVRLGGPFDGFGSLPAAECSAFLYTSSSDGMPNVVVEAMAAGLPIIAPDVGGIGELVDVQTGWLVHQPADPQAYRLALEALLADPDQAAMRVRAGLVRIRERHSFDSFVHQLRAVHGYLN